MSVVSAVHTCCYLPPPPDFVVFVTHLEANTIIRVAEQWGKSSFFLVFVTESQIFFKHFLSPWEMLGDRGSREGVALGCQEEPGEIEESDLRNVNKKEKTSQTLRPPKTMGK